MDTILVTGGAGFIGSNIVDALVERRYNVVVLDDLSTGYKENIAHHLKNKTVTFYEGSILDSGLVRDIMKRHGVSRMSHQAAIPSVAKSIIDPVASTTVNFVGTTNLFNIAAECGCKKIVFASSSSIYGDTPELPKRESMTFNPKSPYAVSKAGKEMLAGVFSKLYDMRIAGLRYFNVYGKRQDPASDYAAVIPKFIAQALQHEPITIEGDGGQTRDFTYIADVIQINLKALLHDYPLPPVFNVAYGERISVLELAQTIIEITKSRSKIVHLPSRAGDIRDSLADIEQAKKHLGYAPDYDVKTGLQETVAWYRQKREVPALA